MFPSTEAMRNMGRIMRGPEHVAIDITNRCNLRCLHCYNRSGVLDESIRGPEISDEIGMALASEIRELEVPSFCFCGGEPLLRLALVIRMLQVIASSPITTPSLVTNGLLLSAYNAKLLKDNGLGMIQVSLDGATPMSHDRLRNQAGAHAKAVLAITHARQAGFKKIAIAFSPTAFNIVEFPQVVRLATDLGATLIRVQPLMRLGTAVHGDADLFPSQQDYLSLARSIKQLRNDYPDVSFEWGDPIDHIIRFSSVLPGFVPYIDIKSTGDIGISSYLPIIIGNIRRHSIGDYWRHGLWRIWSIKVIQEMASFIYADEHFSRRDIPVPVIFEGSNVIMDLIDDRLFERGDAEVGALYRERMSA